MFVRSWSLTRFCVQLGDCVFGRLTYTLEIDAPGLEYMSLEEDQSDRIVVNNLTSLFMVDLNVKFFVEFGVSFDPEDLSKRNEICDFLTRISTVRHIIISHETMKALELYSKVGQIPIFNNLSRLEAEFPSSLILFSPTFLHSFPNLKHLIVNFVYLESEEIEMEMNIALFEFLDAPKCLISNLEHLEIKGLFALEENEMELIGYFLNNSAVLKKLIVSFIGDPDLCGPELDIYKELKKFRKLSKMFDCYGLGCTAI